MKYWLAALLWVGWMTVAGAQESKAPAPAAEKEASLPSARAVLDKYIEASGGREAFTKKKSVLIKGKTEVAGKDLGGSMTLATAAPDKLLLVVDMAGIVVKSGYDGKVGWQVNPLTGPALMEGNELRDMAREADFYSVLHAEDKFKSTENLGKVQFEGEECYKLKLVYKDGADVLEFYSVKTGLQIGFTGTQESSFGAITATSVNNEFKKFGDLLLPSKVTQKMSGLAQTMTIETMEFDSVPDSTFELPAEIKALLAAPAPKKEEATEPKKDPAAGSPKA